MSHYGIGMQTSLQSNYAQEETPATYQKNVQRLTVITHTAASQAERLARTHLLQIGQQMSDCREVNCMTEEGNTQKIASKGIQLTLTAELLQSMIQARELASQNAKKQK